MTEPPAFPLAPGDRVAFLVRRLPPRALCGVVVGDAPDDEAGARRIRVAAQGRTYLVRPRWVRRIP